MLFIDRLCTRYQLPYPFTTRLSPSLLLLLHRSINFVINKPCLRPNLFTSKSPIARPAVRFDTPFRLRELVQRGSLVCAETCDIVVHTDDSSNCHTALQLSTIEHNCFPEYQPSVQVVAEAKLAHWESCFRLQKAVRAGRTLALTPPLMASVSQPKF